jgi:hypothetical protein
VSRLVSWDRARASHREGVTEGMRHTTAALPGTNWQLRWAASKLRLHLPPRFRSPLPSSYTTTAPSSAFTYHLLLYLFVLHLSLILLTFLSLFSERLPLAAHHEVPRRPISLIRRFGQSTDPYRNHSPRCRSSTQRSKRKAHCKLVHNQV